MGKDLDLADVASTSELAQEEYNSLQICHHCGHKLDEKQMLCYYTVANTRYLMHYDCAKEVV